VQILTVYHMHSSGYAWQSAQQGLATNMLSDCCRSCVPALCVLFLAAKKVACLTCFHQTVQQAFSVERNIWLIKMATCIGAVNQDRLLCLAILLALTISPASAVSCKVMTAAMKKVRACCGMLRGPRLGLPATLLQDSARQTCLVSAAEPRLVLCLQSLTSCYVPCRHSLTSNTPRMLRSYR
jgi:hypothetical protein